MHIEVNEEEGGNIAIWKDLKWSKVKSEKQTKKVTCPGIIAIRTKLFFQTWNASKYTLLNDDIKKWT